MRPPRIPTSPIARLALAAALAAAPGVSAQVPQVVERVEVSRVVVDLHVLADDGQPVKGLTAADLRVSVDGKPCIAFSLRQPLHASPPRASRLPSDAGLSGQAASVPAL